MPKSKHAPALFELISKPQKGEGLRAKVAPPPPAVLESPRAVAEDEPEVVRELPPMRVVPREPIESVSSEHPPAGRGAEPWWRIAGGRIRFSLTQRGATIVLAAAGLVLIVAHYAGYSLGEKRGRDSVLAEMSPGVSGAQEIEDARRGPVARRLFEGIGDDPTMTVSASEESAKGVTTAALPAAAQYEPVPTTWVQGHNYIVVQDFRRDARADAELAQGYLEQNGIPSVVLERSGNYAYRLITARGFDRDDQVQRKLADEYQERIRRLGQAYLQAGGRYDFKTAFFIKLTGETW